MEAERPKSSRKRQRSARRLEGPEEAETREDGGVARPPEKKESGSGRETSLKDSGGSVQVGQQSSIQGDALLKFETPAEDMCASQRPMEEAVYTATSPTSPKASLEASPQELVEESQASETLATLATVKEQQPPSVETTETTDPSIAKKPLADINESSESLFPTPPIDDLLMASSGDDSAGGGDGAGIWGERSLSVFQHLDREQGQRSPLPPYTADFSPIHHLLVLTEGETELDSDKEIPDIFSKEDQLQHLSDINELYTGLAEEGLAPYVERFREEAEAEAVMVGKMSLQQIQAEEQRLQSEYLSYQSQEAARQRERQREVARREEGAKREVSRTIRKRRGALKKKKAALTQHSMVRQKEVYSAFNKAEQNMVAALKARKAEVKTLYGHLERADGYYGAVKGRRWKVDWSEAPQPVQIKIKTLRAVRDKLPASRYVLLVSLYDRLGGHVLRWTKMKGQQWGAATLPVEHQGHFYDTEMKFDQSVYTVLPSRPNVRPGMVLVFELFILRGPVTPTDRVIGWGAFPISDADFNIIEGKYKCPFLRGSVDPSTDKHSKVERLMAKDIDNWLANLYFQVIKLPRFLSGMHEYEVELQFTSGLLGYPDHTHDPWGAVDGNDPVFGGEREGALLPKPSTANSLSSNSSSREALPTTETWSGPSSHLLAVPPSRAALTSRLSERLHSVDVSDSDTLSSDDGVSASRSLPHVEKEEEYFQPVQGKPGLHYKVHQLNPLMAPRGGPQTLLPHTPLLSQSQGRRTTSYQQELEQHTVSVKPPFSEKGREEHPAHERLQYVGRQFISELGLSQLRSLEFWGMMVVLLLSWWVRLYLHYIAQYGFLRALGIPINRIDFFPHTVILNYQSSLLYTREEVGVVVLGPLFNTLLFCLLVLLSWVIQRLLGGFPDLGSRFIATFGIMTFLDPFWILAVDMALLRYQAPQPDMPTADVTKLYWHFVALENSGVVGLFLSLFLYTFTSFTTLTCFYMYFLRVHMNGRLLDVYHRLKSPEENFFIPRDMEVSNEELGFVCRKAEQWRGAEGERRKVAVYDYVWEVDELSEDWEGPSRHSHEVTTHISIHTLHLDGLRELYRHFLRLDNGAIVEIFGELTSITGVKSGIKQALVQQHSHLTHPSTPRHTNQHPNTPSLSPPPDGYTDYQTPPQSPPPASSNNIEGSLPSLRQGLVSISEQPITRSPEHLHERKKYHSSVQQSTLLVPTQTVQSMHDSQMHPVPPPVTSGRPSGSTGYLSIDDVPHSSSFGQFRSTGTTLDMEGYESDDDSFFEDSDDPQSLLSWPASFRSDSKVDRKGKQKAGFSKLDSPQKKGRVISVQKQQLAGQLV